LRIITEPSYPDYFIKIFRIGIVVNGTDARKINKKGLFSGAVVV